jgi:LuxR family transcriptional regulator, maltose regulon positive regulatory protein
LIQLWGTILQAQIRTATGRPGDAHRMVGAAAREMVNTDLPAAIRWALSLVEGELRLACADLVGAHELVQACRDAGALPVPAAVLEGSVLLAEGRPTWLPRPSNRTWRRTTSSPPGRTGPGRVWSVPWPARASVTVTRRREATKPPCGWRRRRIFDGIRGGHRLRAFIESLAPTMPVYSPVAAALTATLDAARGGISRPAVTPYRDRHHFERMSTS